MLLCVIGGGGLPWVGGRGIPHLRSGGGTPSQVWGVPRLLRPGMGYPPTQTWDGVPPSPYLDLRWGTPPPCKCEQTENITFPHPSDVGGKNSLHVPVFNISRKWATDDNWTYYTNLSTKAVHSFHKHDFVIFFSEVLWWEIIVSVNSI